MHRFVVFLLSLSLSLFPPRLLSRRLSRQQAAVQTTISTMLRVTSNGLVTVALCLALTLLSSSFVDSRLWLNALIERGIVDRKSGVEKLRHADHPIETKHSDEKSCSELRGLRRRRIILNLREENIEVSLHLNS